MSLSNWLHCLTVLPSTSSQFALLQCKIIHFKYTSFLHPFIRSRKHRLPTLIPISFHTRRVSFSPNPPGFLPISQKSHLPYPWQLMQPSVLGLTFPFLIWLSGTRAQEPPLPYPPWETECHILGISFLSLFWQSGHAVEDLVVLWMIEDDIISRVRSVLSLKSQKQNWREEKNLLMVRRHSYFWTDEDVNGIVKQGT